jgi:hypothetical protein
MATVQRPSTNGIPPYEKVVAREFDRATRRLRALDVGAWVLALGAIILGYGLTVALVDKLWDLSAAVRLTAWCCFMVGSGVFLGYALTRLVWRKVNPHFIARQLEQTVPGAKNSLINWLDLRDQPLAPVIRGSLGRRAAKDVGHADAEKAISARAVWWCGSIAAVLLVVQLGWLAAAPGQVLSLLQRAFFPFDQARIAAQTTLTLLQPVSGDVALAANQPLAVRVQAEGYVPAVNQKDSLKLHFRYHDHEPFEERRLQRDVDGNWTTVVPADQVRNGLWYKITGGDARLPEDREYRVDVRAAPQVLRFEASFKYRPYLRHPDRNVVYDINVRPTIKELRGTELTLTVRTNRVLQQCLLELKTAAGRKELQGEPVAGDPEAWRFRWVLDQNGTFRVLFKSREGEDNIDRQSSTVEVIPDLAPEVVLTRPAKDVALPANGTLAVKGFASDDFGVKSMQLRLKLLKAPTTPELQPKPYRPDVSFQLVNGKYPLRLDYSDFLALDSLRTVTGEAFPLAAGMELEYWLAARDNCDYPDKDGNVGESKRYKLTIQPPETDKNKSAGDRKSAEQQAQQDQKKQDGNQEAQNMQAQAQSDAAQGGNQKQEGNGNGNQQQGDKEKEVADAMNESNSPGTAKGGGEDNKSGAGNPSPSDQGSGKDSGTPGANKQPSSEGKDGGEKGADPGKQKGGPEDPKKNDAGQGKDKSGEGSPGDPKSGGADQGGASAKSAGKGADTDKGAGSGAAKDKGGDPKAGSGQGGGEQGQPKEGVDPKGATPTTKGGAKGTPVATDEPLANSKGAEPSNQPPPADAKAGPPDASQAAGNSKSGDRREATLDDIAKLREQLNDPAQREAAMKGLEKIGEQAGDPAVQKAAEKIFEEARGQPGLAKDDGVPKGTPGLKGQDKGQGKGQETGNADPASGKSGQAKAEPGQSKAEGPKSAPTGAVKNDPTKQGSGIPGVDNRGTTTPEDPANRQPVDEAAARRAADLQLQKLQDQIDKLRKQFTPDVMKKLNWTDKDRDDFLRQKMADALKRAQQKGIAETPPAPGSLAGQIPGTGPRNLQGNRPPESGSVTGERPLAPPELREPQKIFQNPGK